MKEYYSVIELCKDDIKSCFEGKDDYEKICKIIDKLDEGEMEYLAKKIGDALCDNCYWDCLRIVFEDKFLESVYCKEHNIDREAVTIVKD